MAGAKLLLLGLLLFIFISISAAQAQQDQIVLLSLKSYWNNPPALSSWTTSTPYCNWNGVACNTTTKSVTGITLQNQSINGDIPSFVCNLTDLAEFDVYNNSFTGPFPDFSACRNLNRLNLGWNYIVGELPGDVGTVLSTKIVVFDVGANNLTGEIPRSIGKMIGLKELHLDNNFFTGSIPVEIGAISGLEVLTLANIPVVPGRIPPEFGGLRKLRFLWLAEANLIGEIPPSFENLVELEQLDLSINNLTGTIPTGIWSFKNLNYLYLFKNSLSGEIPVTIGAKGLKEIDISMNQLYGSIPEDFGNLQNLHILYLYDNSFSGQIPIGVGNISTLYDIRLFSNKLTGTLPPELGRHSNLWNLEVCQNNLTGELPRDLCAGGILNSLIVFQNDMSGTVPESLGNCYSLVNIQLYENRFTGDVPPAMWKLMNLNTVILHDNNLFGELPEELPWNFTRLDITNNRFSGKIPLRAKNLKVFHGSSNDFSGELPVEMSGLPNIQDLLLGTNKLSGSIPPSFGNLQYLTHLDLSNNLLSGEIPASIGSVPVLTSLDLSNNHLSGKIPSTVGSLKLNSLNLSYNSLTGEVPSEFLNAAYDQSFLSNPGLCSRGASLIGLPSCSTKSNKPEISKVLLILLLVIVISAFIAVTVFGIFTLRDIRRKHAAGDNSISNWKLTPFHKLDFAESTIVNGVLPQNLIGSGGSGQVYKIQLTNRDHDQIVAAKKIWNTQKLDSKLEKQFEAEVEVLGRIRHLNIVKLLCCISNPDSKLLVYEYMENGSLDSWLHGKRHGTSLDWPTRMAIAVGAAKGLCYMHHDCNEVIVHRDVKSSNILLDSDFNAKVADFGLSRILSKSSDPETASVFSGSFGYMAPECSYTKKVNEKVDVFSFGVVLLELTTGRQATAGVNCSLAEWTLRHFQSGDSTEDIMAKELRYNNGPILLEEIDMVMRLGLLCTSTNPSNRPSMKYVLQVLVDSSGERQHREKEKDCLEYVVVNGPLLKKGSRRKKVFDDEDDDSGLLSNVVIIGGGV